MINIYEEVKDAASIAISGHIKPDGDCIGSALGLYLYLKKRCPEKEIVVYIEKPGFSFRNIPALEVINSDFKSDENKIYDIFIALDTVPARMGDAALIFDKAKKTINIDHHISNAAGSVMVNYVVPSASATAELIAELIPREYWDKEIAELLYMGMAHDTGVFKYSNVSPKTMRIAADLIEYGFDFPKMLDETYFEKTDVQMRIQSHIMLNCKRYYDGKLIVGIVNLDTMQQFGANKNDFDGVVSTIRNLVGVECSVFMYEKEPGLFKVSMRASSDLVNVSVICEKFGGGGHVRASGVDIRGREDEIAAMLIAEVGKQIL